MVPGPSFVSPPRIEIDEKLDVYMEKMCERAAVRLTEQALKFADSAARLGLNPDDDFLKWALEHDKSELLYIAKEYVQLLPKEKTNG